MPRWTALAPPTAPPPRAGEGFAYDPALGGAVMFGGCVFGYFSNLSCAASNDTWLYHGGSWSQLLPAAHPPARVSPLLIYDTADQYLLLFGGSTGEATRQCYNDTWEFTGSNWVRIPTTSAPVGCDIAGTYDARDGHVLLLDSNGTYNVEPQTNATWEYLGGLWSLLSVGAGPSPRAMSAMDFDGAQGTVLLFGGWECVTPSGPCTSYNETWTYANPSWNSTRIPGSPSVRNGEVLAFDPVLNDSVLFGGRYKSSSYGDTWLYSGKTWANLSGLGAAPAQRYGAGFIYYPPDSTLLLFGGYGPTVSASFYGNDLWEFGVPKLVIHSFLGTSSTVTVGGGVEFAVNLTSPAGPASFVYTGLPPGCASLNVSVLLCFPSAPGSFTVIVRVTDPIGGSVSASLPLTVLAAAPPVPGPAGPPGPAGSQGPGSAASPSYIAPILWGALALAAAAFGLALVSVVRKPRPPVT